MANAERRYARGYNDEKEDIMSQADKTITEYKQLLTDQIKKYYAGYCEGTDATCMVLPQDSPGIPRRHAAISSTNHQTTVMMSSV